MQWYSGAHNEVWFYWIALHALIGFFGTSLARRYALRRKLIDMPGDRRSHSAATPRGGGISIVVAVLIGLLCLAVLKPAHSNILWAGMVGLVLIAGIGWIDDHRPLSASIRLLTHALAAGALAGTFYSVTEHAAYAAMIFFMTIGLVNIWNFMDGIDGLASSQAAMIAIGYGCQQGNSWVGHGLSFALAAATCGFLVHNFPKAKIFLGDVGSGTLGHVLSLILTLMLLNHRQTTWGAQSVLLIPLSAFIIDAALTLGMRILRGEQWWTAHVAHAYQRWAHRRGHLVVTYSYAIWTLCSVLLMLGLRARNPQFMLAIVSMWYFLAIIAWVLLQRMYRMPSRGLQS